MTFAWWQGLVLGLVQGFTEFLPVSSSGHLVVVEGLLGFASPGVAVEVLLHLATLLAVVIVYRQTIGTLLRGLLRREPVARADLIFLVVASIPAAVVGFAFRDAIARVFDSYTIVGIDFLVTAVVLWSTRWIGGATTRPVTVGSAFVIGLAQAFAILPGVSRSGMTIAAGLWCRLSPVKAAEFSFLMAIIVIAGSGLLEARDMAGLGWNAGLVTAFAGALVSGVVAIRSLVWLLRTRRFHHFAPYCLAIGGFTLLWFAR